MRKLLGVAPSGTTDDVTKAYVDAQDAATLLSAEGYADSVQGIGNYITTSATLVANINYLADGSSSPTYTLPPSSGPGKVIRVTRLDSAPSIVTFATVGSDTIAGPGSLALESCGDTITFWNSGAIGGYWYYYKSYASLPYFEELTIPTTTTVANTWKLLTANTRTAGGSVGTNCYNTSTGIWTCPLTGLYTLRANVEATLSVSTNVRAVLEFNHSLGSANIIARDERSTSGSTNVSWSLYTEIYFNAGDACLLSIYNATGTMTTTAQASRPYEQRVSFRRIGVPGN
jgi:hypothetical protein